MPQSEVLSHHQAPEPAPHLTPEDDQPQPTGERRTDSSDGIRQAIDQVARITVTLREALDDMEEVLETVELAERQKDVDEKEIEALRHALRRLQRDRDSR